MLCAVQRRLLLLSRGGEAQYHLCQSGTLRPRNLWPRSRGFQTGHIGVTGCGSCDTGPGTWLIDAGPALVSRRITEFTSPAFEMTGSLVCTGVTFALAPDFDIGSVIFAVRVRIPVQVGQ
jgi:hypothetical protein